MRTEISPWVDGLARNKGMIATAAAFLVLVIALVWVAFRWNVAADRLAMLEKKEAEGFLQAPSSSRLVRIDPRAPRTIHIDRGRFPERIDLLFHASSGRHSRFRMSLARRDGTLLVHADQMVRDSNLDLRLSFNTSVLPIGQYVVRVEGYGGRGGKLEPFAEAPVEVISRQGVS